MNGLVYDGPAAANPFARIWIMPVGGLVLAAVVYRRLAVVGAERIARLEIIHAPQER